MERDIERIFVKFLLYFGCLDQFKSNLKEYSKDSLEAYLKRYTAEKDLINREGRYILNSFEWKNTREGYRYWSDISKNWMRVSRLDMAYLKNCIQVRVGESQETEYGRFECRAGDSKTSCGGCHFLSTKKISCYKHRMACTSRNRFDGKDVVFVLADGKGGCV